MSKFNIVVTRPSCFKKSVDIFDAKFHEIYMSTNGVLNIKGYGRIVKSYAEGQWETAEEVKSND